MRENPASCLAAKGASCACVRFGLSRLPFRWRQNVENSHVTFGMPPKIGIDVLKPRTTLPPGILHSRFAACRHPRGHALTFPAPALHSLSIRAGRSWGSPRHRARMPPCSGANVEKCPLPPRLQAASFPWPTPSARRCSSRRGRGGLRGVPPSLFVAAAGHRLRVHADTWAAMRPCGLCDWRGRPLSGYSAPERPLLAHRKGLYVSAGRPNKKRRPLAGPPRSHTL